MGLFSFFNQGLAEKLDRILVNQRIIMATLAQFEAGFARIDVATTEIATIIRTIGSQIGSMTDDQENVAKARLEGVAVALEALASAGPSNPVPVPVPL